jgi:F-type H+-transporting ATPase subunit epsilon
MNLAILLPTETLVDREVAKVVAKAPNGFFCLLPRHVDFITALVPGILTFTTPEGGEVFVAVDEGILLKQAAHVWVSTRNAAMGSALGGLREAVSQFLQKRDAHEEKAVQAMNRIEAGFVRRFLDIQREA